MKNEFKNPIGLQHYHLGGGVECSFALTKDGRWDMYKAIRFDENFREDLLRFKSIGDIPLRLALSWSQVHIARGKYDFSRFIKMMDIARELDMHIIWDLNHFDFPEWLDLFSNEFPEIFKEYALEALRVVEEHSDDNELWFVPWNEISFFAQFAGEEGHFAPFAKHRGVELKYKIIQAVIIASNAMKDASDKVRLIATDPVLWRHAKWAQPELEKEADDFNNHAVFEAWDMLLGLKNPELGGSRRIVDRIGMHYYFQEFMERDRRTGEVERTRIKLGDPYLVPPSVLMWKLWQRYGIRILITETGGCGSDRMHFWRYMLQQLEIARVEMGVPIDGFYSYPILDTPSWGRKDATGLPKFDKAGFWDIMPGDPDMVRHAHVELIQLIGKYLRYKVNKKGE